MINPAEGGDFHLAKTGDFQLAVDSTRVIALLSTRGKTACSTIRDAR